MKAQNDTRWRYPLGMTDGAYEIIEALDQMFLEKGKGRAEMPPMDHCQANRGCAGGCRQVSGTKVLLN